MSEEREKYGFTIQHQGGDDCSEACGVIRRQVKRIADLEAEVERLSDCGYWERKCTNATDRICELEGKLEKLRGRWKDERLSVPRLIMQRETARLALGNLLAACYAADLTESLPDIIDGGLLDAARKALAARPEKGHRIAKAMNDAEWANEIDELFEKANAPADLPGGEPEPVCCMCDRSDGVVETTAAGTNIHRRCLNDAALGRLSSELLPND